MEAGNHDDVPCNDAVKNAVRETAQHAAANIFSNDRKALWIFSDRLHHLLDRFQEF